MAEYLRSEAGSLESGDVLIQVVPEIEGIRIELKSSVLALYGKQIEGQIRDFLFAQNIENIALSVQDRGALDYVIEARLITALLRAGYKLKT